MADPAALCVANTYGPGDRQPGPAPEAVGRAARFFMERGTRRDRSTPPR